MKDLPSFSYPWKNHSKDLILFLILKKLKNNFFKIKYFSLDKKEEFLKCLFSLSEKGMKVMTYEKYIESKISSSVSTKEKENLIEEEKKD